MTVSVYNLGTSQTGAGAGADSLTGLCLALTDGQSLPSDRHDCSHQHQTGDSCSLLANNNNFVPEKVRTVLYTVSASVRGQNQNKRVAASSLLSVTKALLLYSSEWTNYNRNIRWSWR